MEIRPSCRTGSPVDVVTGFLKDDGSGKAYGRPVGVMVDKAGALLVADDLGNTCVARDRSASTMNKGRIKDVMKAPGKAGAISRCKSDPGKAVAGRLEVRDGKERFLERQKQASIRHHSRARASQ
jgi:hypothetical protein